MAGIGFTNSSTPGYELWNYDGFNRVKGYRNATTEALYTYKVGGLRTSKTVNGQTINHIWDGSHMVMETDESKQVLDKYYRGRGLVKSDSNGYYLFNAHGDVIQMADQQGLVTNSYLYDAFGVEKTNNINDTNKFRYAGEYYDQERSLIYLRARY